MNQLLYLIVLPTIGRRSKVAQEILSTERSYVASLKLVVEVIFTSHVVIGLSLRDHLVRKQLFIVPLKDKGNEQIISSDERRALFSELEVDTGS